MKTEEFNAILKDTSDETLINRVQHGLTKMCVNREVFTMSIPPDPERDFDILLGELIRRYKLRLPVEAGVKPATCGLDLIIQEKKEKQDKKWGLEHDYKMHPNKELLKAALFCITNEEKYKQGWQFEEKLKIGFADGKLSIVEWEIRRFKKAGAFIASQIDILLEEKNRSKLSV